ncbi:MAG: hypothetical protein II249_01050, partial [Bacteroidaceae bacterium]|nr:hypothetical protein [Bacteroidaceae bacterium]
MATIWRYRINVVNPQDAEKMKDYVRELSKEYTLVPASDDPNDGGLEYGDDKVWYTDVFVERLDQFNEICDKVAAHFPEMKLQFTQFNTDNQCIYRYESKDGEFVRISPLKVTLYTNDAEDFNQLLACAEPLLAAQGINAEVNTATQEITWGYSKKNESQVCDALIAKMSEQMPDIQVVGMKHDVDSPEFGGLQYCIMGKGEGEWKEITGATFDIAYAICSPLSALELTVYDAFTDPARCVKAMLEEIRKGKLQDLEYWVKDIIFQEQKFVHLLQPEDKQWLLDLDRTEVDCFVLAGMYRSWRTWEESFTDEDTGETVTVERHELLTTPLFESHEGEAEALLEKVCKDRDTHYNIKDIVWTLSTYTPLNYTRLLVDNIENLYGENRQWAYKEIGDLYRWGKEEFGFFIDKQKAKEYYDKAGVTDENPLEDSDDYGEPDPCIYTYTVRGDIAPLKELAEKIANRYGDVDNE